MKIATFTKSFQDWPIPVVCHRFKQIGLDGLDLTVRRKGHIEPKDVANQLPVAAKAALEAGVQILLLTTDLTEPNADAEAVLDAAGRLGITRIKLGYYLYKPFGTLAKQMDDARQRIAAMAKLARKYGVLPCVHIHSGNFIPSHGTMLYELIRDLPPDQVGAYVDTLHMALEGGGEGWRQGLDLLSPWVQMVSVKNFAWHSGDRDRQGQLRWRHQVVPVADGISPIPEFVATLRKMNFDGIFSMHSEYKGSHSFKDLDTEACLAQTAEDLKFLRPLLK
jgi:sugar phosphate isomerase/epimerase